MALLFRFMDKWCSFDYLLTILYRTQYTRNRRKTMDLGFDVVVTITGIVLVFLILILLMAIITLEGKIFDSMNAKKKAAKEAAKAPAVQPAAPVQQAAAAPAPQVEEGIPGDVIAAIMAAIHAMGSRISGSNSLTMARYSKKQPTQIITAYR